MKRKRVPDRQKPVLKKLKGMRGLHCLAFLCVGFVFLISACGGTSPPPAIPQKGKSPAIVKKVDSAKVPDKKEEEKKEEEEYAYNPLGKPDPFRPFIQMAPSKESSRKTPQTPLQKYEIAQLILVAIIIFIYCFPSFPPLLG